MIRLLLLALPVSLAGWWGLRRLGWPGERAWMGGVALSFALLGAAVLLGHEDREGGRLLAAALWAGLHLILFLLLRPWLGRGPNRS